MNNKNHIKKVREKIETIISKLKQDYDPEQIILFGSYAYGNPTDESDIDLLIIKETQEPILARWMSVRKLVTDLRKGLASPRSSLPHQSSKSGLIMGIHFIKRFYRKERSFMSDKESTLPDDWFKKGDDDSHS